MRLNGKELPGFGSSLAAILITVLIDHFCSQAEPQRAAGLAWAQPLPPGTQPGPDNFRPQRFVPPFPPITEFGLQPVPQVANRINPTELVLGADSPGKQAYVDTMRRRHADIAAFNTV